MAKAKQSSKTTKKSNTKRTVRNNSSPVFFAAALLFAGACVVILGNIQGINSLKLIMAGFGAAMLVFGGVLLGLAAKSKN